MKQGKGGVEGGDVGSGGEEGRGGGWGQGWVKGEQTSCVLRS